MCIGRQAGYRPVEARSSNGPPGQPDLWRNARSSINGNDPRQGATDIPVPEGCSFIASPHEAKGCGWNERGSGCGVGGWGLYGR